MKMNRLFLLLLGLSGSAHAAGYDVAADFSITNNPQDPWSYGSTPAPGGSFNLLTVATRDFDGVAGWNQWSAAVNTTPGVYKNNGASTVTNDDALVPPGTFVLRPGAGTELSVARWTAPSEGYWRITGRFTGVQAATSDVHIRDGSSAVFDGNINGLGQAQAFDFTLNSYPGETLDFLAGNGGNGDAHDLTGLAVTIMNAAVLTIEKLGDNVILRWPAAAASFQLEVNPSLTAPNDWTPVAEFPDLDGAFWKLTRHLVPGGEFFRLHFVQAQSS